MCSSNKKTESKFIIKVVKVTHLNLALFKANCFGWSFFKCTSSKDVH